MPELNFVVRSFLFPLVVLGGSNHSFVDPNKSCNPNPNPNPSPSPLSYSSDSLYLAM